MTVHTRSPDAVPPRPPAPGAGTHRRRRFDPGRSFARILCFLLALVGVLPFAAAAVLRSPWARGWAARETAKVLAAQGIPASYAMALRVWPLAIELDGVRVESSDGGAPALTCDRVSIRPRLFALLAGKLAIDQVELDVPRVRAVIKDGQLVNLALKKSSAPTPETTWPARAPFNAFAVTDASFVLDVDQAHVEAQSVDLDVTADDEPAFGGAAFEVALRLGRATVQTTRAGEAGQPLLDDDALCSIEGRARLAPTEVLVRRFEGTASVDLDGAPGTTPPCELPAGDKRRVELSLGHLRIGLGGPKGAAPPMDGHVRVRLPVGLAGRAVRLPETDGWVGLEADVHYTPDALLPELTGTFEGHDLRLAQYSLARELHGQVILHQNRIESPKTTLTIAGGLATLTDTVIDPFAKGVRLEHTKLDVSHADFTALLRDLGIHPHSYVGWELREVHTTTLAGTLAPLKVDGELTARTSAFGVYDRPAEDRERRRIVGVTEAQIATHVAIRTDALRFEGVHVGMPRSRIDGGLVSIGFHNDLRVDVPKLSADLDDVSPIGSVVMHGRVDASAHVGGTFSRPELEGDVEAIVGLVIGDIAFGDVSAAHVKVDMSPPKLEIAGLHARRRESAYDVPTAAIRFGNGFAVDAVGESGGFDLRDLLSMFNLEDDPRYAGLGAKIATRANVHVGVGGEEDTCGSGYLVVDAKSHLKDVVLYGERFAQGDADVALHWYDRLQGIAGADVDVRSFVLDKARPPTGTRPGAAGTVLGSASIRRGGALTANVVVESVPLSRVDALGAFAAQTDGIVSGVAHVTGNLDDFKPDAGFVASVEIDVAGTRVRGVALPPSHLDVQMTQRFTRQTRAVGHTRCGAPIGPPFDRAAYLADTSSHGDLTVDGTLLGNTVSLGHVVLTREKSPHLSGRVALRGVDLGALGRAYAGHHVEGEERALPGGAGVSGQLWGEIMIDDIPLETPSRARVRVLVGPTVLSLGRQRLTLKPPGSPVVIADDTLVLPSLEVTLDTPEGFRGGFVVAGGVHALTTAPSLALDARLEPVDLAVAERFAPQVTRASGTLEGSLDVTGPLGAPVIAGELHARADNLEVHGLPGAVTDVVLDARATATELSAVGSARFAGGSIALRATMPIRRLDLGALDAHVTAQNLRISPVDGVTTTLDADLEVTYDPSATGGDTAALPHVMGEITLDSFAYTRPISLASDLTQLGGRAKRTKVDAYDPALDAVAFDVRIRSRRPLVLKNNLAELQMAIDSGTLDVSGTNQRLGLRGSLKTLPGGRFHFQDSDFDVRQGLVRFDDPSRIDPNVDITAVTEYRRYTDTSAGAGAGAGAGASGGPSAASTGSTRGGALWRITLHAYGDADNVKVDMTSEPSLSQEDIVLLLAVGMTRAELDQLQASNIGASIALNYLGAASGAATAVKRALPVVDDFRFGSAYSTVTGKTEPQLTIGKRIASNVRASVTAGLSEDREVRSNIEWRLNDRLSVQGSYDNINDVSSSALGNIGVDLRWRLEFE